MAELKGITVRLKERTHAAIKRLAFIDGRSVREFTRLLCVGKVKDEVGKGTLGEEFLEEEEADES